MESKLIHPARRLEQVEEYYFSAKLAEVARMRQQGINVINLGIGSPDMPPAADVITEIGRSASEGRNHGYQAYRGIAALRNAFASWYMRYFNVELDASTEILPLIGSKEGIMHISMAFLDPGDEVLVPDPGYPAYSAAAKLAGGTPRPYNLSEDRGWLPDIEAIETAGVKRVKMMWINYPHMPTGARATPELFERLVSFAGRNGLLLCHDNPYSFILNNEYLSLFSVPGAFDVSLELNSLSKSHNMAGWRIGMVAGNSSYINDILKFKSNMDSGMFLPLQSAAAIALDATDTWYEDLNRIYQRRRTIAADIMNALSCTFEPGQSGLFLWGRIPAFYADAVEMTERLLQEKHLFITPGSVFGNNGKRYVRISLCADEELLLAALERVRSRETP